LTKAPVLSISWVLLSLDKLLRLLSTSYELRHSLLVISLAVTAERSPVIPGSVTIIKAYSKKQLNVLNKSNIYIHNNEFWQQIHLVYTYKIFKVIPPQTGHFKNVATCSQKGSGNKGRDFKF